jgi:hypothetical protein
MHRDQLLLKLLLAISDYVQICDLLRMCALRCEANSGDDLSCDPSQHAEMYNGYYYGEQNTWILYGKNGYVVVPMPGVLQCALSAPSTVEIESCESRMCIGCPKNVSCQMASLRRLSVPWRLLSNQGSARRLLLHQSLPHPT